MSGEVIELTGARAPKKPATEQRPTEPPLIEPAVAPTFVSNVKPHVVVLGGIATVYFASLEMPLYDGGKNPQAVIQAKLAIPEAMLQEFAIALAQAAGARIVEQADGGADDETH